MVCIEVLDRILRRVQASCLVGPPISAVLIGPSGCGKSQLTLQSRFSTTRILSDFTAYSLVSMLGREKPPYILVPDFNAIVSHRPTVATLTCAMLLGITGEGSFDIPGLDGGVKVQFETLTKSGYRCGLITCITPGTFESKRGKWRSIGLLRRLVPIYYTYSTSTVAAISSDIASTGGSGYKIGELRGPSKPSKPIRIDPNVSTELKRFAESCFPNLGWVAYHKGMGKNLVQAADFPFDLHKVFRTYARACALLRKSPIVDKVDLDLVYEAAQFIRYDRPQPI